MEKIRLKAGEEYWFIDVDGEILCRYESYSCQDDMMFDYNNYFHTKEEAEAMAEKIRAVLNGADVIEMPSEEDINKQGIEFISDLHGRLYNTTSEEMCLQLITYNACGKWLKSKIVR